MEIESESSEVTDGNQLGREIEEQVDVRKSVDELSPKESVLNEDKDNADSMSQAECNLNESPEQKALRVPTVLDIITEHLTFEDMKKFRLVNSVWDDVISVHMLKNDISIIKFEYDSKRSKYIFDSKFRRDPSYKQKMLTDLLRILRSSKRFPCASFSFLEGDLTEPEIDIFFTLQGQKIKTLRYHRLEERSRSWWLSQATVTDILTNKAPNIECLEMEDFCEMDWDESNQLVLPSLKILTSLDCHDPNNPLYIDTAFAMVAAAPRLEKVYNFDPTYIEWFLTNNKVDTIKKFTIWPPMVENFDNLGMGYVGNLVKFVKAKPQLEHLIIPYTSIFASLDLYNKQKLSNILNFLLEASKSSLRTLEVVSLTVLPGIRLPKLDKLATLRFVAPSNFDGRRQKETPAFPPGLTLEEVFPNVNFVSIRLGDHQHELGTFLPLDSFTGSLPRVNCLELSYYESLEKFVPEILHKMMPNVTKMIHCAGDFDDITDLVVELENICQEFSGLEEIELRRPNSFSTPSFLDSVITGIPEDVCLDLRSSLGNITTCQPNGQEIVDLEAFKKNWTICDLQSLKRLKISFDNKGLVEKDRFPSIQVPSHLTGYALQKKPDLEAIIAYHQHCKSSAVYANALQSIAPFVKLVHEDMNFGYL